MLKVATFFALALVASAGTLHDVLASSLVPGVLLERMSEEEQLRSGAVSPFRLLATQDLSPQRIAKIPWSACFAAPKQARAVSQATPGQQLMLGLLMEPPAWISDVPISSPLLWDPEREILSLQGTQVYTQIMEQQKFLQDSYAAVVKPVLATSPHLAEKLTYLRWKWALAVVTALQYVPEKEPLVVPWIALFSFGQRGTAHLHQTDTNELEIWLNATVKKGAVIVLNDDLAGAETTNARIFFFYGLLLSKRPFGFAVSVGLDREDQMYGNKREAFDKYFGNGGKASPTQDFVLNGDAVPPGLLFALRVMNCQVAEGHDLPRALLGEQISLQNEKRSWEQLGYLCLERLQKYPTTIEQDKVVLETQQMDRNEKNAVLFRRAEKRILLKTLAQVDAVNSELHKKIGMRETDVLRQKDDNTFETVL
jgi:hypothetical protein